MIWKFISVTIIFSISTTASAMDCANFSVSWPGSCFNYTDKTSTGGGSRRIFISQEGCEVLKIRGRETIEIGRKVVNIPQEIFKDSDGRLSRYKSVQENYWNENRDVLNINMHNVSVEPDTLKELDSAHEFKGTIKMVDKVLLVDEWFEIDGQRISRSDCEYCENPDYNNYPLFPCTHHW
jgi:hypothetical protein